MIEEQFRKGIYRHYKGNYYELLDVATHSETLEPMVVYRALYGERGVWVRPARMWNEFVRGADGKRVIRFAYVEEEDRTGIKVFSESDLARLLPERDANVNKGDFGYVALVGGSLQYSGAIRLSGLANAAMRSGAGVATLAVPASIANIDASAVTVSTVFPLRDTDGSLQFEAAQFAQLMARYKVIAFGMGLGNTPETAKALDFLLKNYESILIVDADGLNAMAGLDREAVKAAKPKLVLTPHVKEFSRLSGESVSEITIHPMSSARTLARQLGAVVVLKGSDSFITDGNEIYINSRGTPGMATAGSGDVLAGILSAVAAIHPDDLLFAAAGACYINGAAGELAAEKLGTVSMLATDTAACIPDVLRQDGPEESTVPADE